ncbi:MAG: DNA primase catalytic subunit PriS [Methanobacteriota archaeon]
MVGDDSFKPSVEFLKNRFREYYETSTVELPDRFGRREFAFVLFEGKGMIRHLGFPRKNELMMFLRDRAPAHAYYSSAYYQKPDASTMQEKQWMGAELIFDLDSDHLPNAERLSYEESLVQVKKEFRKLVEEFLLGDFGFHEKYIDLYFSGGRGYHCHVRDPAVFDMDSNERRELVDYITGQDFQDSVVFHEQVLGTKRYGSQSFASGKTLRMPSPDESGWKGRISRGIIDLVEEIKASDDPIGKLEEYGVKRSEAEKLVADLSDERMKRIQSGYLDQSKTIRRFFLNRALRKTAVSLSAGETDEPVTCDVKRLIRLPYSLHGKTGLQVCKVTIDGLTDFDPLTDAVVFPGDHVKVQVLHPFSITMKNEDFHLDEGEHTVPTYVAVFLLGRRAAQIVV